MVGPLCQFSTSFVCVWTTPRWNGEVFLFCLCSAVGGSKQRQNNGEIISVKEGLAGVPDPSAPFVPLVYGLLVHSPCCTRLHRAASCSESCLNVLTKFTHWFVIDGNFSVADKHLLTAFTFFWWSPQQIIMLHVEFYVWCPSLRSPSGLGAWRCGWGNEGNVGFSVLPRDILGCDRTGDWSTLQSEVNKLHPLLHMTIKVVCFF